LEEATVMLKNHAYGERRRFVTSAVEVTKQHGCRLWRAVAKGRDQQRDEGISSNALSTLSE
jgi:hypothetical protein